MKRTNAKYYGNEIKAHIIAEGLTLTEVANRLADRYGWSTSLPAFSGKLHRGTISYTETVEIADILGFDIIWAKRMC